MVNEAQPGQMRVEDLRRILDGADPNALVALDEDDVFTGLYVSGIGPVVKLHRAEGPVQCAWCNKPSVCCLQGDPACEGHIQTAMLKVGMALRAVREAAAAARD